MIRIYFSEKVRWLLRAGLICLPLGCLSAEPAPVVAPAPVALGNPLTTLIFDADAKECKTKIGDSQGKFTFYMTNISDTPIHIISIHGSCGCTRAEMPQTPWIIPPHTNLQLRAVMDLAGKPPGATTKLLYISSTNGSKQLSVTSIIPKPEPAAMTEADRQKNAELAKADSTAIFKNDCASCHVEKGKGLVGAALYKESCGICHDSDHRATFVPDLRALNHPTDANFWRTMVAGGKTNTLMPAFSQERGGFLSKEQIDSLVAYLTTDFTREKPTGQTKPTPSTTQPTNQPPRAKLESQAAGRVL